MRISDWSSDVCSSDLDRCHRRRWRRVCAHRRPRLTTAPRPQGPHRPVWGLNGGPAEPMRCPVTEITRRELDEAVEGQTIASRALQTFAEHPDRRSEEHTSELQSLMRISYAVFCLKKKK